MVIHKRRITAAEDVEEQVVDNGAEEGAEGVIVDEGASDLLFEAEDVAELLAEVTGQPIEVTADEGNVVFAVGDDEFTVEAEGNEEILESVRKPLRGKRAVAASTRRPAGRTPAARAGRTVRKAGR